MGVDTKAESEPTVASRLGGRLIRARDGDVGERREAARQRRLGRLALILGIPTLFLWWRIVDGRAIEVLRTPSMPNDPYLMILPLFFVVLIAVIIIGPLMAGRSPHVMYRPEQIDTTLDDVKGIAPVVDEVVKSLNTFLGYAQFRDRLGGNPRRGLLFEGPPGTGKTHLAKAMAHEAGVPFLFVSATSFQSMWYGATARKIRSYFRALREESRKHGGAIGFIEELDAIGVARSGLRSQARPMVSGISACCAAPVIAASGDQGAQGPGTEVSTMGSSEGVGGVVNELLIQMQSFDSPSRGDSFFNFWARALNAFLPEPRQIPLRKPDYVNILLIAATNRAGDLDPALLRPGRFDRTLSFEPPAKPARRELVDHFLARKAHAPELDLDAERERIANTTFGFTPVMIEHLFDEALVLALTDGRDAFNARDVAKARLTQTIGLANPVPYTARERRTVATHEAGHATVAFLSDTRSLEVLSIIKRRGALGLLAHGETEEVWTRTRKEMHDLVDIALGGMVAEELFFGAAGTGPSSDLAYATQIGSEIVGSCGMSTTLASLAAVSQSFGGSNLVGRVLADSIARPALEELLSDSKERVTRTLEANRHIIEALRDALLDRDELVGEEILDVIASAGAPVRDDLRVEAAADGQARSSTADHP